VVIADEAHRAKDSKSKQTRALWAVAHGAGYRWALTGTPTLNTPGDLWAIGRFYDPDTYGDSRHKWHNRFVDYIETQWGPKDIGLRKDRRPEFNAWFDMTFIRRTKDEVLDLPELTYQTRELELTSKQKSAYNRMVDDMIVAVEGGVLLATDPLALLTRLSQIASATPVVDELDVVGLDLPSNKVAALLEILDEMDDDRQLVVFAQSRKLIELAEGELLRKGIGTVSITGRVKAEQRDMNVSTFQSGGARVALCTLGAGSEGINLYAADTAVFLQRSYAYGMNQQAESRIHRNGQTADKVTIIDLVSKGTLDEDVIAVLHSKAGMAEEVLRDQARQLLKEKV
jgi:SNF2 family DNA or RNA helicase